MTSMPNNPPAMSDPVPSASPTPKSRRSVIIISLLVIVIILVAGGSWAYVSGWNPFQPTRSPDEVVKKMLDSIPEIKSAQYTVNASFKSEAREPGAQPITVDVPEISQQKEAITRDQQRLSDLSMLESQLNFRKEDKQPYPTSLAQMVGPTEVPKDPQSDQPYQYQIERGGTGFRLQVQLETDAAARAYQKALAAETLQPTTTPTTSPVDHTIVVTETTPVVYASVSLSDVSAFPLGAELDDVYQYLPVEIDANLQASGQSGTDVTKTNDASSSLSGKINLGGTSFSAGLDLLKQAQAWYVRVNEAPSLGFFDLAALKGKWIKAVPEDTYGTVFGALFAANNEHSVDQESARMVKQYQTLFKVLKDENLVQVTQVLPQEKTDAETFYHYAIKLDRNKFADFYRRLHEETQKELGDEAPFKYNEETLTYLQSPEFAKLCDAFEKNIQLELWINARNFEPSKISYTVRLVPPDTVTKLQGKQYRFNLSVGLAHINQPIKVTAPTETISVDQARNLLTGESLERIKFDRQVAQVEAIRDALRLYYDYTGHDPQNLTELLKKINELSVPSPKTTKDSTFSNYELQDLKDKNKPFLTILPKDLYTGADYAYTSDGKTYKLTYHITYPPKDPNDLSNYQSEADHSSYVEGVNTATETTMSVEADAVRVKNF